MELQNINPFSLIDNRLKSIESTLAIIAAKEQPQPEKKYYTIAEAANKLNVAAITLYRNGAAGKIPTKKIGSRLMIPGSFVDSK
jgi:excisionase family DNA binding protein